VKLASGCYISCKLVLTNKPGGIELALHTRPSVWRPIGGAQVAYSLEIKGKLRLMIKSELNELVHFFEKKNYQVVVLHVVLIRNKKLWSGDIFPGYCR
jgi:hypothetical protein